MSTRSAAVAEQMAGLPDGFVYIDELIPDILLDLKYCTAHNFVGERIDGYLQPRGILSRDAAVALGQVQAELAGSSLALKIFDAYRPQQAVDHFERWAADLPDTRMKAEFYPQLDKQGLFREGYLARRSSHSRGSTADLTLVSLSVQPGAAELDMGTIFDFFGPQSWPDYAGVTPQQRANRTLLHGLMTSYGFASHPLEWWHFTLKDEPFPDTWFNFPVQ